MDEDQVQELARDGLNKARNGGWLLNMNQAETFEETEIATASAAWRPR